MRFDQKAGVARMSAVMAACLGLGFALGCGGESTQPKSEVLAMAGILVARGQPVGSAFQAGAVVSVDGRAVTDALVQINGATLTYQDDPARPEETGYVGQVMASQGDVLTLTVTAAGQTVTHQATVPGMVEIHTPAGGFVYGDDQDIPISWEPAAGSLLTIVACSGATATTPLTWLVAPGLTTRTIPGSATTVPGNRITVMGISGTGDLPSTMDLRQWPGKNGFWVTSQDFIDVRITG